MAKFTEVYGSSVARWIKAGVYYMADQKTVVPEEIAALPADEGRAAMAKLQADANAAAAAAHDALNKDGDGDGVKDADTNADGQITREERAAQLDGLSAAAVKGIAEDLGLEVASGSGSKAKNVEAILVDEFGPA